MKKFKFEDLQLTDIENIYVVTYDSKVVSLEGKNTFTSAASAKNRLRKVLTANYQQGHYWHKDKDNTFSKEGGHMRNGGVMSGLTKIFNKLGKELTDELLHNDIFTIVKLQ